MKTSMNANRSSSQSNFDCASDLSHAIRPLLGSQLIATKPADFSSRIGYRRLDSHLELFWGSHSYFSGILMPKKSHMLTIERSTNAHVFNGYTLDAVEDPLALTLAPAEKAFDLSVSNLMCPVSVMVDPVHWAYLYETLTHEPVDAFLDKPITRFKSRRHREHVLGKIIPFTQEGPSGQGFGADAETDILESLIQGLDREVLSRGLSYCKNIALQAHEKLIATPHRKISLTEICLELGVAARSLQKGFKDLYGMGFIEYHRIYRLHRLRKYIKKNGLKSGDLTDLIGMYGFEHAGRFSLEYKKIFGVSPSKDKKRVEIESPLIADL